MKPWDAMAQLERVIAALQAGARLEPALYAWFVGALQRRVRDPEAHLDHLLELRTRSHGRGGGANSELPTRDRQIRELAALLPGTNADRAREIRRRWLAGDLRALKGRPVSVRQLQTILSAK